MSEENIGSSQQQASSSTVISVPSQQGAPQSSGGADSAYPPLFVVVILALIAASAVCGIIFIRKKRVVPPIETPSPALPQPTTTENVQNAAEAKGTESLDGAKTAAGEKPGEQPSAAQSPGETEKAQQEARDLQAKTQAGKTLAEGLTKTRNGFIASLTSFFKKGKTIDESVLSELEDVFFSADIGVHTAMGLLDFAKKHLKSDELADPEKLKAALKDEMSRIVSLDAPPIDFGSAKPYVLMVAGVNGAGKTTTIGKLAAKLTRSGKKVILAAGDTFRAAAAEQLVVWGERSGAEVVKGKENADPGAVIFEAIKKGIADGADVVIADTAGRLHTKAPLMEEIARVHRVMGKALPGAPHQVLLVLDSTNGQNAIAQAREFNSALKLDGIVLTKLDGTAKGGVVIGICDELKIPVRYIGIGESVDDLREFDGRAFVDALFEQ